MKMKRVLCVVLALVLCMCTFAGCSKKGRTIKGASKDAQKMVAVVEERFDMKGVKTVFDIDTTDLQMKGEVLQDEKNNYRVDLSITMEDDDMKLDGKVLTLYYVDNVIYLDVNPLVDQILPVLEKEGTSLSDLLSGVNLTEDEFKKMLVLKLDLGDIDLSFFNSKDAIKYQQDLMDIIAVCLTDAECLETFKDSYKVKLNENSTEAIVKLIDSFLKQYETIYNVSEDFMNKMDAEGLVTKIIDKFATDVKGYTSDDASKSYVDMMAAYVKKEAANMNASSSTVDKNQLFQVVSQVRSIISAYGPAAMTGVLKGAEIYVNITDQKDGFKTNARFSSDGISSVMNMEVTEYKEVITAPSSATDLAEIVGKYALPLLAIIGGGEED